MAPPEVVISGHWHTWTERVWQPSNMNGKTLVAEAASYLQYIGELEVTGAGKYVQACKHPIRTAEITPDADVEALIANLVSEYNNAEPAHGLYDVIGYAAVDLTLDKDKWWTVSEYPWNAANAAGAWITDAMVWKAAQLGFEADLALQSGGGIRRDIAAGEVTYVEIYEAYPWSDDSMVLVEMTGQEIWNWIQADYVGTSISDGWHVTAHDGGITGITYNGAAIDLAGTYSVAISEYMFAHPEITLADTTAQAVGYSIREGVVDYTAQYSSPETPMYPGGISPRYTLNTEFAGGFKAVVTMTADSESQPYFEEVFIRFTEAMPETLARRTGYGLSGLVNSDGSINLENRFSEIMLYRSHLGFPDGLLQPGDIIEVWGEGSSFDGTVEFIDQEGIYGADEQFVFHGHDETLARPEYHGAIASFLDDDHENRYVKFYAAKTGNTTVRDADGQQITIYQPGGYYTRTLPGSVGDILELTGVNTEEDDGSRRFRCHAAVTAASAGVSGYPPTSAVDAMSARQSGTAIVLTATASDAGGTSPIKVDFFYRYAPDGLGWSHWTGIGADSEAADGWSLEFDYPEGQGSYEFYTLSTDADGNVEDAPVRADARTLFNNPPTAPADPDASLADGATDVSLSPTLSVTVSDPDHAVVDVYFYDASGNLIGSDIGVPSGGSAGVVWEALSPGTQYSWYVEIDDGLDRTISDTWTFITMAVQPVPAAGPAALVVTGAGLLLAGALACRRWMK